MPQPLKGYRIADFSHVMAGPFCTHFLRLLGADVIKVESFAGDAMRNYGPFREWDGMAPAFVAANSDKRSIALDLKHPDGLEVARRLVSQSDVVVENFRPGVMRRLGLGYETCRQLRPKLVFCSISGYGQQGRLRDYPAIDNIVQATSGMMAANGDEGDPPSRVGWPVVDTYTGTLAALAVLAALLQRERFGEGQHIDVAMLDASVVMLTSLATPYLMTGQMLPRTGDTGYSGAPTAGMYSARDGATLSLGVVQNNQFAALCRCIGRPELIDDMRFASPVARVQPANAGVLRALLTEVIATRDGAEWELMLNASGAPCGLVRDVARVCDLARASGRNLIMPIEVCAPGGQAMQAGVVNAGFVFERDGPGGAESVPALSANARDVLKELGYTDPEAERLFAAHAVRAPE
jgi:CoA:oxalate CoA-transferase